MGIFTGIMNYFVKDTSNIILWVSVYVRVNINVKDLAMATFKFTYIVRTLIKVNSATYIYVDWLNL